MVASVYEVQPVVLKTGKRIELERYCHPTADAACMSLFYSDLNGFYVCLAAIVHHKADNVISILG